MKNKYWHTNYIKEEIKTFGEDVSRGVTSPSTSRLSDVTGGAENLLQEKAANFHSTVKNCCEY